MSFVGVRLKASNPFALDIFLHRFCRVEEWKCVISHFETFFFSSFFLRLYNYMDHKIRRFFFSLVQIFLFLGITSHLTLHPWKFIVFYCSLNFEIVEIERIKHFWCCVVFKLLIYLAPLFIHLYRHY